MEPQKLIVILIFCLVVRGFLTVILAPYSDRYYLELATQVIFNLSLFGFCAYQFHLRRAQLRIIVGKIDFNFAWQGAVLGCLLLMFTFGESALRTWFISQTDIVLAYAEGNFHTVASLYHPFFSVHVVSYLISCVILPAIFEEFFFRGLLFPAIALKRSEITSAILCSLAFVMVHSLTSFSLNTFIFSFALCLVYRKTGSLFICVSAHAFYNFFAFIIQYYFDFHRTRAIDQISSIADWIPQLLMFLISIAAFVAIVVEHRDFLLACARRVREGK